MVAIGLIGGQPLFPALPKALFHLGDFLRRNPDEVLANPAPFLAFKILGSHPVALRPTNQALFEERQVCGFDPLAVVFDQARSLRILVALFGDGLVHLLLTREPAPIMPHVPQSPAGFQVVGIGLDHGPQGLPARRIPTGVHAPPIQGPELVRVAFGLG